jgi:hypothetical protein
MNAALASARSVAIPTRHRTAATAWTNRRAVDGDDDDGMRVSTNADTARGSAKSYPQDAIRKMRLIACIEEPDVAKKILEHLGLRAEPLPSLRRTVSLP